MVSEHHLSERVVFKNHAYTPVPCAQLNRGNAPRVDTRMYSVRVFKARKCVSAHLVSGMRSVRKVYNSCDWNFATHQRRALSFFCRFFGARPPVSFGKHE